MPIAATVIGRLGHDPSSREAGRSTVTKLSVASDHGWGDRKTTTWVNVSIWGKAGENAKKMLSKGDGVICIGELHQRQYQGKDGTTKYSVDLENASWHFPPKSANSGQSRGGGGGYSSQSNNQSSNNQSESGGGYDESIPF